MSKVTSKLPSFAGVTFGVKIFTPEHVVTKLWVFCKRQTFVVTYGMHYCVRLRKYFDTFLNHFDNLAPRMLGIIELVLAS